MSWMSKQEKETQEQRKRHIRKAQCRVGGAVVESHGRASRLLGSDAVAGTDHRMHPHTRLSRL